MGLGSDQLLTTSGGGVPEDSTKLCAGHPVGGGAHSQGFRGATGMGLGARPRSGGRAASGPQQAGEAVGRKNVPGEGTATGDEGRHKVLKHIGSGPRNRSESARRAGSREP